MDTPPCAARNTPCGFFDCLAYLPLPDDGLEIPDPPVGGVVGLMTFVTGLAPCCPPPAGAGRLCGVAPPVTALALRSAIATIFHGSIHSMIWSSVKDIQNPAVPWTCSPMPPSSVILC